MKENEYIPLTIEDYIPNVVKRLYEKIKSDNFNKIVLLGFSDNMKWLNTIFKKNKTKLVLADWRNKFIGYDCGGEILISILDVENSEDNLIVVCNEKVNEIKDAINFIIDNNLLKPKYLFDNFISNDPFNHESPYKQIALKAKSRATSMITDDQLFDLIQFIEQTSEVEGDIVEFGSLHGGSGAVITEAVNYFTPNKKVWLFDTFQGIPKSKFGLDYHWDNSFMNNSYMEVSEAFKDLDNVKVIKGDLNQTYLKVKNKISFGYIASDTYESGILLLEFIWNKLNRGGIISICDYGSFPNCYPITVAVDRFVKNKKKEIFVFRPANLGFYILKK